MEYILSIFAQILIPLITLRKCVYNHFFSCHFQSVNMVVGDFVVMNTVDTVKIPHVNLQVENVMRDVNQVGLEPNVLTVRPVISFKSILSQVINDTAGKASSRSQ